MRASFLHREQNNYNSNNNSGATQCERNSRPVVTIIPLKHVNLPKTGLENSSSCVHYRPCTALGFVAARKTAFLLCGENIWETRK